MSLVIVIPCFNESQRLQINVFIQYTNQHPDVEMVFVNDGSIDSTLEILRKMELESKQIHVLDLVSNKGKAAAVREGMLYVSANFNCDYIGFWDADLATPLEELDKFQSVLFNNKFDIVMGLRLLRLGAHVHRTRKRHILGRVFATCASVMLGLSVYDTQCGAKIFKSSVVSALFKDEFITRWLFDVELLARYINLFGKSAANTTIFELPLTHWQEVGGSSVKVKDFLKAPIELMNIWRKYIKK